VCARVYAYDEFNEIDIIINILLHMLNKKITRMQGRYFFRSWAGGRAGNIFRSDS
jgi:hypothetical protein